jgi:hypothetical protein
LEINLFSRTVAGIETGQATLDQVGDGTGHGLMVAYCFLCVVIGKTPLKETAGKDWLFL